MPPRVLTTAVESVDDKGNKLICGFRTIKKTIGEGAFAKVHLVEDVKTGEQYAMKKMSRMFLKKKRITIVVDGRPTMSNQLEKCKGEVGYLSRLSHENIVTLHAVIDDPSYDGYCLLLDYAAKGQIMHWNGKQSKYYTTIHTTTPEGGIPAREARKAMTCVLNALEYLHAQQIIHRDIKPDNLIVFADGSMKLCDFGIAKELDDLMNADGMVMDSAGTEYYYSPEACSGEEYSGFGADIWALGVTLYIMAVGELPFDSPGSPACSQQVLDAVLEAKIAWPESSADLDPNWKDLIVNMLNPDLSQRIVSVEAIREHPFMTAT